MTALRLANLFLLGALLGCGSPDGPSIVDTPPVVPSLESVPFALLGSGKIAFERIFQVTGAQSIYVVDATAASSMHSFDNAIAFGPALSPDGRRLAYTTYSGNTTLYDVYIANIDGTGVQHVTSFPLQEGPPSWTPDGAKIVMVAGDNSSLVDNIFSQSAIPNPGDVTQLTHFTATPGVPLTCPTIILNDVSVSISPQGLLALACYSAEIDVLSSNGSLSVAYVPSRADRQNWPNVFSPKWSPDGTRLAFIETVSDQTTNSNINAFKVKIMNADGTNITTIVTRSGSDSQALGGWLGLNNISLCWMPDGSRLVFNIPESVFVGHLWVVLPDGSGLTQLTSAPSVWDRSVSCSRS